MPPRHEISISVVEDILAEARARHAEARRNNRRQSAARGLAHAITVAGELAAESAGVKKPGTLYEAFEVAKRYPNHLGPVYTGGFDVEALFRAWMIAASPAIGSEFAKATLEQAVMWIAKERGHSGRDAARIAVAATRLRLRRSRAHAKEILSSRVPLADEQGKELPQVERAKVVSLERRKWLDDAISTWRSKLARLRELGTAAWAIPVVEKQLAWFEAMSK
jgi:hypothetical protein